MSRLLTIGEYSGNPFLVSNKATDSTLTAGTKKVYLKQHPSDDDFYTYRFDDRGNAEFGVRIAMDAANDTELQSLIDLVHAQLLAVRSGEVKFEYASGSKRWELPVDWQSSFTVEAELMGDDEGCWFDCTFRSGPEAGAGGVGTVIGVPTWRIVFTAGGFMEVVGECTFADRTDANNWIDDLDGGTLPDWMDPAEFELFDHAIVTEGVDVTASPPATDDGAGKQHFVTVNIRQHTDELSGAKFSMMRDFSFDWDFADMPANSGYNHNELPSRTIMIHGTFWFKTGKNDDWNAADATKSAIAEVYQQAERAMDAVLDAAASHFPFRVRELQRKGRLRRRTGEYPFEMMCVMPDLNHKLISAEEHVDLHFDPEFEFLTRADGVKNAFADPGGMSVTLTHRYRVTSFSRPSYRPPKVVGGTWVCAPGSIPDPQPERYLNGSAQTWTLDATVTWHRLSKSAGDIVKPIEMGKKVDPRFFMRGS